MKDEQLRQLGLKVTNQRLKVLQLLSEPNIGHISAEDIYARLKQQGDDIGLATVYRVLGQFEQAGLVIRHSFEDDRSVFELDDGEHHDHMVCVRCQGVIEFVDPVIEQRQKEIAARYNYKMEDHDLVIYGVCPACQRAPSGS